LVVPTLPFIYRAFAAAGTASLRTKGRNSNNGLRVSGRTDRSEQLLTRTAAELFHRDYDLPCSQFHPSPDLPNVVANHVCADHRMRGDLEEADSGLAPPAGLLIGIQDPPAYPESAEDVNSPLVGLIQDVGAPVQLDGRWWNEPEHINGVQPLPCTSLPLNCPEPPTRHKCSVLVHLSTAEASSHPVLTPTTPEASVGALLNTGATYGKLSSRFR
jgi:hypothetical protein